MGFDELLEFKGNRVREEFLLMLSGEAPDALVPLLMFAAGVSGTRFEIQPLVTQLWRTSEEQHSLIAIRNQQRAAAGLPPIPAETQSQHQHWMAADLSIKRYSRKQAETLCQIVNARFKRRSAKPVLAIHTEGTALHLHLQVDSPLAFEC